MGVARRARAVSCGRIISRTIFNVGEIGVINSRVSRVIVKGNNEGKFRARELAWGYRVRRVHQIISLSTLIGETAIPIAENFSM